MFFILDTVAKALCFQVGYLLGVFVLPIVLHSMFGLPL
jgi:hypothetical protein